MTLKQRLAEYVRACFTGIWIESHEHQDALSEIAQLCRDEGWQLASWNVAGGLNLAGQSAEEAGSDPLAAIRAINSLATPDGSAILVLQNFHRFLQSAEIVQALVQQIIAGKQNRTFIVIMSPAVQIPTELEKLIAVAASRRFNTPRPLDRPQNFPPWGCCSGRPSGQAVWPARSTGSWHR